MVYNNSEINKRNNFMSTKIEPNTTKTKKSSSKYNKFKGQANPGSKKQVSIGSISNESLASIRNYSQNSIKLSKNSLANPSLSIINTRNSKSLFHHSTPKTKLQRVLDMVQHLFQEMKDLMDKVNNEIERTVDNVTRQVRKQIFIFMHEQLGVQQDLQELEQLFKNSPKKNDQQFKCKVFRAESITTKQSKMQRSTVHTNRKPSGFQQLLRVRQGLKKQAKGLKKIEHYEEIDKNIDMKQKHLEEDEISPAHRRQSNNRIRNRSVSQKVKDLQSKIGSIKNILQK